MYEQLIQRLADHYSTMALNPASIDHARHRVRLLREDDSGLFVDLPRLVKERIDEKKNQAKSLQTGGSDQDGNDGSSSSPQGSDRQSPY